MKLYKFITNVIKAHKMPASVELHKAIKICDSDGHVYDPAVLDVIELGDVVRISYCVSNHHFDVWTHDAPYILIEKERTEAGKKIFIGYIMDINRSSKNNKYPIQIHESISFMLENIIEIPICEQNSENVSELKGYLTDEYLPVTGPLFTIQTESTGDDYVSCSDESSNSAADADESASDNESETSSIEFDS